MSRNYQEGIRCSSRGLTRSKKKHWSPTTVAAIVRDEIYIGTRILGKTRCSMHTGHKAVLNDKGWVKQNGFPWKITITTILKRHFFKKTK